MRTIALMLSLAALPVLAQTQSKGNPPNLNGAWAVYRAGRGAAADPKLAAPAAGPMLLKSPYADAYKKRQAAEREADQRGEPLGNRGTLCIPYGMPQMMSAIYPLEILQTPGQITIITEAFSEVRRIYLDEPQAKMGEVAPGYYGHSVGHWDGDMLMVDTIGIKEEVLGFRSMPHSDQVRITERFHLAAPDVLHDQVTVEDPVTLEKPWTFTFAYRRTPNYHLLEYVCENNREYLDDNGVTRLKLQDH
ncbi:MAG TPA: hypothetical protein VN841_09280 [Bryobacteraceae bacterium]|nr:hypothetical protein [Bryobacteraceae bacterium]